MKAVVLEELGGPDKLAVQDIETPEPKEGEVRVALQAAALNRRDLWITLGLYPKIQLPCITGSDGAGVVDALGGGVDPALLNQEVIIYPARDWGDNPHVQSPEFRILGMPDQGTFAEYICVDQKYVYSKPAHLNFTETASFPVAGLTAWRSVITQGEVTKNHNVLITGAGGGVSSFALAWCVHIGAKVYVSSGSEQKIAWARSMGAIDGVDYHEDNCYKELSRKVGGFDVIIDSSGGDTLNELLGSLKPGGRYVFYGATRLNPSQGLEMAKLFFRQIRIQGTSMGTPDEFKAMLEFTEHHGIHPAVHKIFALDAIVEAHQLMEKSAQTGKILIKIRH
jgi:NADPH:quinone reductase-like Zn-dependent oxidoreductase